MELFNMVSGLGQAFSMHPPGGFEIGKMWAGASAVDRSSESSAVGFLEVLVACQMGNFPAWLGRWPRRSQSGQLICPAFQSFQNRKLDHLLQGIGSLPSGLSEGYEFEFVALVGGSPEGCRHLVSGLAGVRAEWRDFVGSCVTASFSGTTMVAD